MRHKKEAQKELLSLFDQFLDMTQYFGLFDERASEVAHELMKGEYSAGITKEKEGYFVEFYAKSDLLETYEMEIPASVKFSLEDLLKECVIMWRDPSGLVSLLREYADKIEQQADEINVDVY